MRPVFPSSLFFFPVLDGNTARVMVMLQVHVQGVDRAKDLGPLFE